MLALKQGSREKMWTCIHLLQIFRKRGRRNVVASDFFRFLPFSSVFSVFFSFFCPFPFLFLFFFRFFPFFPFSSVSFPFSSVSFSEKKKTGRRRLGDRFCETPTLAEILEILK